MKSVPVLHLLIYLLAILHLFIENRTLNRQNQNPELIEHVEDE